MPTSSVPANALINACSATSVSASEVAEQRL
jgi:hypothetical protein